MKSDELTTKADLEKFKEDILQGVSLAIEKVKSNGASIKEWLTTKEVQDLFSIKSANTLQNLKKKGLRSVKLGGKCLFYYPDLIQFIRKGK